jgi:hypothetical protein
MTREELLDRIEKLIREALLTSDQDEKQRLIRLAEGFMDLADQRCAQEGECRRREGWD